MLIEIKALRHHIDISHFIIVGNYEADVRVKGLNNGAMLDMLALMPDDGFSSRVERDMPLDEFLDLLNKMNEFTL